MKNFILPTLFLLVGLAIGYFVAKENCKPDLNDGKENFDTKAIRSFNKENSFLLTDSLRGANTGSRRIDSAVARALMAEFVTQNELSASPLLTSAKERSRGFYIHAAVLKKLLDQPDACGLSFYYAKNHQNSGDNENFYSLIMVAARKKVTKDAKDPDSLENFPPFYNYLEPCPTVCGIK